MDTKCCSSCNRTLPIENFNFKDKATGKRQSRCAECTRAAGKVQYEKNKEAFVARAAKNRPALVARNREFADAFLSESECSCCKATENLCFYAGGPDSGNQAVYMAVNRGCSLESVQEAISNSVVMCKKCQGEMFISTTLPWQTSTADERKLIQAEREAQGFVPRNRADYKQYIPVNRSAAAPRENSAGLGYA